MRLGTCPLCERVAPVSRHHLTPRSQEKKKAKRKKDRDAEPVALAGTCIDCHRKVHSLYSNKTLAEQFASIEKLKEAPGIPEWLAFIKKKPGTERVHSRGRKDR